MIAVAQAKVPLAQWNEEHQTFTFFDALVSIRQDTKANHIDLSARVAGDEVPIPEASYEVLLELAVQYLQSAS
jgi:hypothetical protein